MAKQGARQSLAARAGETEKFEEEEARKALRTAVQKGATNHSTGNSSSILEIATASHFLSRTASSLKVQ